MNATQTPQPLSPEQKTALAQKARAAANAIQYSSDPTHVGALAIYFKAVKPAVVLALLNQPLGIAMDGVAQKLGLDMFDYTESDVYNAIDELKRLSQLGEGDGGAYALQSLAAYFRESGNWDSYNAIRKAAHLANMCIDTGGADQMNGFASECPLCGDHFRDE